MGLCSLMAALAQCSCEKTGQVICFKTINTLVCTKTSVGSSPQAPKSQVSIVKTLKFKNTRGSAECWKSACLGRGAPQPGAVG